jgi:heptosyltransferase-1
LRKHIRAAVLRVLRLIAKREAELPIAAPRRILILQLQQLGDTVVFTPTLRALRQQFPDSVIDLLASSVAAQLYAKSPHPTRIFVASGWGSRAHGTRLTPIIPLLRALRARRYDCVIADATQHSFKYSLIAFAIGAPLRIGFDVHEGGALFTCRLPLSADIPLAYSNLAIARALGADSPSPLEEVSFDAEDTGSVDTLLATLGASPSIPLGVIHPGSNWQSKLWYPERFASLADALVREAGCAIVFVGTALEENAVERTRAAMKSPSLSLVARTSLTQLAALCARASVFVGTDSGPRNVAGAVGAPTVVVMSAQEGTNRWIGHRPTETAVRADARCMGCYYSYCAHRLCMDAIGDEDVIRVALAMLAAPRGTVRVSRILQKSVPSGLYERVAGTAAADCRTLRYLARSKRA